jgi:hypothetical protein
MSDIDLGALVQGAFADQREAQQRADAARDRVAQATRDLSAARAELVAAERREQQSQTFLRTVWEHFKADHLAAAPLPEGQDQ